MTIGHLNSAGYPRYGTVMNIATLPVNLIKTFSLAAPSGFSTSDGYPNGTLTSGVASQGTAPDGYYDKLLLKFHGQAQMGAIGTCAIIYSSSNLTFPGIANNCVGNNFQFSNSNSAVDARVVFKHGALITGVSGGGGSSVVLTLVNQPSNITVGGKVKIGVGVSTNLSTGPNSDGSWTVSAIGSNTITLLNSSGVTSPTVTGSGGPDIQSEAVCSVPGIAWSFTSGQTYTNFSNLVFCKLVNESAVDAGNQVDPDYSSQLKTLGVAWLRTMDASGVQSNWETDFSARRPTSYISWAGSIRNPNYDVGTITNNGVVSGGDDLTCSAPSLTSTGAYKHGEVITGVISAATTTNFPTLNVAGRGKKKIIQGGWPPLNIIFTSAASGAGLTLAFTLTASWLNGNTPYVFNYVTTASGHFGSDLTSAAILQANVQFAFSNDAIIKGTIASGNSGSFGLYPLTPQSGALTVSYSGTPTLTLFQMPLLDGNSNPFFGTGTSTCTFIYDYILDAFYARQGGQIQSVPFEYYTELANSVGAGIWHNWPILTTINYVQGATAFFRDNLLPGLRLMTEVGNEMWNFGAAPWGYAIALGFALGMGTSTNYENGASYSYSGLRTIQFGNAAITTWTTTRPRKDLYVGVMSAQWDMGNWDTNFLGGALMGGTTCLTYGGPDGVAGSTNAASNYSSFPNRVGDFMDAGGFAPYWGSSFLSGDTGGSGFNTNTLTGTVTQNAPLFTAADKYRDGNLTGGSGAYDDLYTHFYTAVSLGGPAGGLNLLATYKNQNSPQLEGILEKYDTSRRSSQGRPIAVLHYEAGPQFGLGNINNGTNTPTVDIAAVSNHIATNIANSSWDISSYTTFGTVAISSGTYDTSTGLITLTLASPISVPVAAPILGLTGTGTNLSHLNGGWNVSTPTVTSTTLILKGPAGQGATTISGGTLYLNAMDLATNICGMVYNFKFSTQFYQLYKNYFTDVTTVHSNRESCGSQYGYAGGQWAMLPGSYTLGLASGYSSVQATIDFNAGL